MINDIHLQNFRSYEDETFEFSPAVNIIVGPNASGKTNLLEALLVISRNGSYRVKDNELINFDSDWTRIEANAERFNKVIKISRTGLDRSTKAYEINTKKSKIAKFEQTIPVVLFEPNHLALLIGSPEVRRNFIDEILDQTSSGYKTTRAQYRRALSQRNKLLKSLSPKKSEVFVWNIRLSELGGKLFKERMGLVDMIEKNIGELYNLLSSGHEKLEIIYKTNISPNNYETNLFNQLEKSISLDADRGFTSSGPHRDDLSIQIDGNLAGEVASRGETRSIVLALKIVESRLIEEARGQKPILMFDDVFSELDGARRLALTNSLSDHQAFITTTDADIVIQHFTQTANIIPTVRKK